MVAENPSRSSTPAESGFGHVAPPPTPFNCLSPRSHNMDSETAHSTRSSTPSSIADPDGLPPLSRQDTIETSERAPPSESKKKKKSVARHNISLWGSWKPALTLENSGSVARDHLASERTFLAYMRTSLTIASTGVALVQLFTISAATTNKTLEHYSRPIGAVIIGIGLATLLLGLVRYFTIQAALVSGNYPVARVSTILLAMIMSAVIVAVFGIILGVREHS